MYIPRSENVPRDRWPFLKLPLLKENARIALLNSWRGPNPREGIHIRYGAGGGGDWGVQIPVTLEQVKLSQNSDTQSNVWATFHVLV